MDYKSIFSTISLHAAFDNNYRGGWGDYTLKIIYAPVCYSSIPAVLKGDMLMVYNGYIIEYMWIY